jgi:hypothetical protein
MRNNYTFRPLGLLPLAPRGAGGRLYPGLLDAAPKREDGLVAVGVRQLVGGFLQVEGLAAGEPLQYLLVSYQIEEKFSNS